MYKLYDFRVTFNKIFAAKIDRFFDFRMSSQMISPQFIFYSICLVCVCVWVAAQFTKCVIYAMHDFLISP